MAAADRVIGNRELARFPAYNGGGVGQLEAPTLIRTLKDEECEHGY
jgi:hypothetical protein